MRRTNSRLLAVCGGVLAVGLFTQLGRPLAVEASPTPASSLDCRVTDAATDLSPLDATQAWILEARATGVESVYSLAVHAAGCALEASPMDPELRWWRATAWQQAHRFEQAEAEARWLMDHRQDWRDAVLLGDSLAEQGQWDDAAVAWQAAMDARPNPVVYDRFGWYFEHKGDLTAAEEAYELASSTPDPSLRAWALTRLGAIHLQMGLDAPEIEQALLVIEDFAPARALMEE